MRALRDREKSVRGVAAAGLGKLVTSKTKSDVRADVESALKRVAAEDKDKFVRRQAKKAYTAILDLKAKSSSSSKKIFVDVGVMGDKTGKNKSMRELMRATIKKTLSKKAPSATVGMGDGKKPSKAKLRRLAAFHVDGTLTELSVKKSGRGSEIGCKVSMLIATFPKKSMFGVLEGGAKVRTGGSDKAIGFGKEDCVKAVVADLIARRVIPTLQSRAK